MEYILLFGVVAMCCAAVGILGYMKRSAAADAGKRDAQSQQRARFTRAGKVEPVAALRQKRQRGQQFGRR